VSYYEPKMRSKNQAREIPHINSFVRFAEAKHTTIPPTQLVRMSQSRMLPVRESIISLSGFIRQDLNRQKCPASSVRRGNRIEIKYVSYLSSETRALVWTTAVRRGLEADLGGCHVAMLLPGV